MSGNRNTLPEFLCDCVCVSISVCASVSVSVTVHLSMEEDEEGCACMQPHLGYMRNQLTNKTTD